MARADKKKELFRSPPGIDAKTVGPFASVFLDDGRASDGSDYRAVPASDRGNASYRDQGQRGSFGPHNRDQWDDPQGLKRFSGYGADEADLRQGFISDAVGEDPAYDLINYKDRSILPKNVNEDFGNTSSMPDDFEFRGRNRISRGFLKRPHLPTER